MGAELNGLWVVLKWLMRLINWTLLWIFHLILPSSMCQQIPFDRNIESSYMVLKFICLLSTTHLEASLRADAQVERAVLQSWVKLLANHYEWDLHAQELEEEIVTYLTVTGIRWDGLCMWIPQPAFHPHSLEFYHWCSVQRRNWLIVGVAPPLCSWEEKHKSMRYAYLTLRGHC